MYSSGSRRRLKVIGMLLSASSLGTTAAAEIEDDETQRGHARRRYVVAPWPS
jgi:hypothetical protein